MSAAPERGTGRRALHSRPLIDGRRAPNGPGAVLHRRIQRLLTSEGERAEAELEQRIRARPGTTRPNTIALISSNRGVGKTTSTFIAGNLLASHLKLRAIAVDADPEFAALARLAPDKCRAEGSLTDLLHDADRLNTAAELTPYVSRLPTGLHVLGAPRDGLPASLGPEHYGELVAFLSTFYEVVLLDLGTGLAGALARFAIARADQFVLVTTPDWVTSTTLRDALSQLQKDRTIVAINNSHLRFPALDVVEQRFRAEHRHRAVAIPRDEQLAAMLDSGTYTLDALRRRTRLAIKRLGVAISEQLV